MLGAPVANGFWDIKCLELVSAENICENNHGPLLDQSVAEVKWLLIFTWIKGKEK